MKKVAVLIPCYNEAQAIGQVISDLPRHELTRAGYHLDIIVIDNNSTDHTAQVAKRQGARVIFEPRQGKGIAVRTGMSSLSPDTSYVVMLDGDGSYKSQEIIRLLEPLSSGFCDAVVGSRLSGKITLHSMPFSHRVGNWLFSFLVRVTYFANITDVLSGYFAWKYNVISQLRPLLTSSDFKIEMEMITKMAKMGHSIYSVPITYDARIGTSSLNAFRDGWKIFSQYLSDLYWQPPQP